MPSETIRNLYEEMKFLSQEIGRLSLPEKFIEAAREQNSTKLEELFEEFKDENPELWERFSKLYEDYAEAGYPEIFDDDDIDDCFIYDPNQINPLNICFVFMFSEGIMSSEDVFALWDESLQEALWEAKQYELSNFMGCYVIDNLVGNLMYAFKKK